MGNAAAITKDGEVIRWPASIHSLKILAPASYPRRVTLPYTSKGYTLGHPAATTAPDGDVVRVVNPIYLDGVLTQQWESRAFTQEEIDANSAAIQKEHTDAIQKMMDAEAQYMGYDGILSLCSYAASTNPVFKREADIAVPWRDTVWSAGYKIIADVKSGVRTLPTTEEMLGELPKPVWP